jgi:hypothetical protein
MLRTNGSFHAKSGAQAELPEDHCGDSESAEQKSDNEEESEGS